MTTEELRDHLRRYVARNVGQGGVEIDYTNHKGERGVRRIVPKTDSLRLASDAEWHSGKWVFDAWDMTKDGVRTFAVEQVHGWRVLGEAVWG